MSKLNDILKETKDRLELIDDVDISLKGKVVVAYNEDDLLDVLKGVMSYPAVGVLYEGMRSMPEAGSTGKIGVSCEVVISFVVVMQGNAIHRTDEKKTKAIDYLDRMRDSFLGQRSTVTTHFWHYLVEAPAALRSGMVCWVQRWSLPVQFRPKFPPV